MKSNDIKIMKFEKLKSQTNNPIPVINKTCYILKAGF